ncbi:hypothetical protein PCA20602_05106 [Pandoraea capi]|uniref:DUF2971 domain-containing protein n=2 Tax=Pandoraea capi TaxID=2508286 RepID=A0ABY6WCG4_9BURK|nr:hypothetical protein PCA20602_05106 [Pandoraea capi]
MSKTTRPKSSVRELKRHFEHLRTSLWSDVDSGNSYPAVRPLLAHYTSIDTLHQIIKNEELWFSNPLFMNDVQELRFGMVEGQKAFFQHAGLRLACKTPARYQMLCHAFEHYFSEFEQAHAFDTYIMCLSEHDSTDQDGRLSMWRGYGANGNGAALVFNTGNLTVKEGSPLILSRVIYATTGQRLAWIDGKLDGLAQSIERENFATKHLYAAAYTFLERLKIFSLFTKHKGFEEEREWRVAYMRDRDGANAFDPLLSYVIGSQGLQPKLKFKVAPLPGATGDDLHLSKLVDRIILGPTVSSDMSRMVIRRMLEHCGKPELTERVVASTTPYRS